MDIADASLVAAAEALDQTRIFTIDAHFYAYRLNGKTPFDVVP
jgi:predicted nucleic acid-binding protein